MQDHEVTGDWPAPRAARRVVAALMRTHVVAEFDRDGRLLNAGPRFLTALGLSGAEMRACRHADLAGDTFHQGLPFAEAWARLCDGATLSGAFRLRPAGRGEVWLQGSYDPVPGADGRTETILLIADDVTEARRQAQEHERLMQEIIELAPHGVALLDADCRILHANQALSTLTGFRMDELLALRLVDLIPPSHEVISDAQRDLLRSGEMKLLRMEYPIVRKDRTEGWALLHVSRQVMAGIAAAEFIVQIQDISERRMIDQMKTDFVASVSHELRTPLSSIHGALRLLDATTPAKADDTMARLLEIASRSCERLLSLVNDLLEVEHISSGLTRFATRAEALHPLLERAIALNAPYGGELDVGFELMAGAENARVSVDAGRFQQVMANLMSNAAKFSPPGSIVRLGCEMRDDMVCVTVTDDGPGVPEHFRESIFLPFTQVDNSATRRAGGTGLGLNITRQIVARMNGSIGYRNVEPQGCEFWIKLPPA